MNTMLNRSELAAMVKAGMAHARAHTIEQAPEVLKLSADRYYDPEIFAAEVKRIFRRLPLLLAVTAEMPKPGDFKTIEAAGVPVLITRGQDEVVRAFVNSCSHRGTSVATEVHGNARRFMCPYHGWTFTQKGELMGVASAEDFGDIDKSCYGLVPLPVTERAGLIWVIVDPAATLSFDAFFAGYDDRRHDGRLWTYDVTGGRYEERDYVATGSGSLHAGTVIKVGFRTGMDREAAVNLVCRALWEAADADSATGGPDALRSIYPVVATVTSDGFQRVEDPELRTKYEAIAAESLNR